MLISQKTYGKHSKWSRYRSQKVPVDPGTWSYEIDDKLWPSRPRDTIRTLTVNLNRYPLTYYSQIVVANLILSSQPDVVFLQEISTTSMVKTLVDFLNDYLGVDTYSYIIGATSIRNLQLSSIYNSVDWSSPIKNILFTGHELPYRPFPRLPLMLTLEGDSFDLSFTNIHLLSHRAQDDSTLREEAFETLGGYFDYTPENQLLLLGGDFNTTDTSALYSEYLSQFELDYLPYRWSADVMLIHGSNINDLITDKFSQYLWNLVNYLGISVQDWKTYVSDHEPVILDMPIR